MELFISGTLGEAKGRNAESRSASMTQNGELGRPDADRRNLDSIYESSAIRCWRWSSSIFGEDPASKLSFLCRSGPASKRGVSKNNDYQATHEAKDVPYCGTNIFSAATMRDTLPLEYSPGLSSFVHKFKGLSFIAVCRDLLISGILDALRYPIHFAGPQSFKQPRMDRYRGGDIDTRFQRSPETSREDSSR